DGFRWNGNKNFLFPPGWAKNILGEKRKKKKTLLNELDVIDRKSEISMLSPQEWEYKHYLNAELSKLLREQEIYWIQRSKATNEGVIIGQNNLKDYITKYYKKLFAEPESNHFSLNEELRVDKVFLLPGAPGYNKQGDPLSPILFNIVVDMLAVGVISEKTNSLSIFMFSFFETGQVELINEDGVRFRNMPHASIGAEAGIFQYIPHSNKKISLLIYASFYS
ncbi:hypothetical protein ACJX0J_029577, partial [Zea mays]